MRRKSARNAQKPTPDKPSKEEQVTPKTRRSRRRKRSPSKSTDSDEEIITVTKRTPVEEIPDTTTKSHTPSDEEAAEEPIWKVTPTDDSPKGEIQKLKICLTRPSPDSPEKGKSRRSKSRSQTEDDATSSDDRVRKTRSHGSPVARTDGLSSQEGEEDGESKKGKGKSKGKHKSKIEKSSHLSDAETQPNNEISENVQVTHQSPSIDNENDSKSNENDDAQNIIESQEKINVQEESVSNDQVSDKDQCSTEDVQKQTTSKNKKEDSDDEPLSAIQKNTTDVIEEVAEPVQKQDAAESVQQQDIAEPIQEHGIPEPVQQQDIGEPVQQQDTAEPEPPKPVQQQDTAEPPKPVQQQDTAEPPKPVQQQNVAECVEQQEESLDNKADGQQSNKTEEVKNQPENVIEESIENEEKNNTPPIVKSPEVIPTVEGKMVDEPMPVENEDKSNMPSTEKLPEVISTVEDNVKIDEPRQVEEASSNNNVITEEQEQENKEAKETATKETETISKPSVTDEENSVKEEKKSKVEEQPVKPATKTHRLKLNRNNPNLTETVESDLPAINPSQIKRKWECNQVSSLFKVDLESIQIVCPTIEFPEEPDLTMEVEKERRKSVNEPSGKISERKVSVEYKSDSSERPSYDKQSSVASTMDSEDNSNIIAFNRKISIVDDTASKLRPPPSPAKNPVSSILYITNLVRPFTVKQLRELLERTGKIQEDGFWTDKIKSKCYVKYQNEEEAEITRNALHSVQWPIGNGKKLIIDYATDEDMQNAINPPAPPVVVAPDTKTAIKENLEPSADRQRQEDRISKEVEKKRTEGPVREWDIGKREFPDDRSRSRERNRKHRRSPSPSEDFISKKQRRKEEYVPQKMMDDLFLKTKATPSIFWQPLSPEEIAMKQQQRLMRMEEHKRRMEENSRMRPRDMGRGGFRRRYD